ncbi:MAG: 3-dehydroquinate synthase [Draconibacterium sp.]|nr:MAG: 3-dehydroquinate synthase [Draconibacterium sp.]
MEFSNIYSKIIYTPQWEQSLSDLISSYPKGKVFLATEENVDHLCLSNNDFFERNGIKKVVIPAGENHKKISSVEKIWTFLSSGGADRKSLLINVGGGMLTDLGGFAASTFKRGIDFINVPTTLLSQVDASVGGKTGINFNGLKNEIGVFKEPIAVVINTGFLKTLDRENFLSGFAEMIKHGLIHSTDHLNELKAFNVKDIDYTKLSDAIQHSVDIKSWFVAKDPTEKNIRKALNFGHTAGHAFESLAMEQNRPILHGYAVAYGMITELLLSVQTCNFPLEDYKNLISWLTTLYGSFEITNTDFERIYELMTHDKKNESGKINFTLLPRPGEIEINTHCSKASVYEALHHFEKQ